MKDNPETFDFEEVLLTNNPDFLMDYGFSLEHVDNYKALMCYEKALENKPDFEEALVNKSNMLIRLDQHQDAMETCLLAKLINPNDPILFNNLGQACVRLGFYKEGLKNFNRALELNNNYQNASINKNNAILNFEYYCKEMTIMESDYDDDEPSLDLLFGITMTLYGLGNFEESILYCNKALKIDPKAVLFETLIGTCYLRLKQIDKAIECLSDILKKHPNSIGALYSMGKIYQNEKFEIEKDYDSRLMAIPYFDKILEIDPQYELAFKSKITVLVLTRNYDRALFYLKSSC